MVEARQRHFDEARIESHAASLHWDRSAATSAVARSRTSVTCRRHSGRDLSKLASSSTARLQGRKGSPGSTVWRVSAWGISMQC
jgi:hypothetical protein